MVLGAVTAAAGLFFYLRVIVVMFFQPAPGIGPGTARAPLAVPRGALIAILVALAVTIFFGLVPWPLLDWVQSAVPL